MPSLRKRVSSYLRQLSFHNEPRDKRNNINENAFITKYLQGSITLREGPPINYGKIPTDLPNFELGKYEWGSNSIVGSYTGPKGGLTTVKRTEKHLSVPDDDIDFIDNPEAEPILPPIPKKSPKRVSGQPIDNTTMVIKVAGNEYCVTNKPKRHSKSYSLGSISDFNNCIEVEKTKIERKLSNCDKNQIDCTEEIVCDTKSDLCNVEPLKGTSSEVNNADKPKLENKPNLSKPNIVNTHNSKHSSSSTSKSNGVKIGGSTSSKSEQNQNKYALSKSRSDGNPFHHNNKKRGKIIQVQRHQRQQGDESIENLDPNSQANDTCLPSDWNQKSECCYGISDSLYDRNQVTRQKNGDPIADCFGIIARNDSAILAVADGVNWGEKASIAAKSAVHGSLHYLNKTIFNDTKLFESLTNKTDDLDLSGDSLTHGDIGSMVTNTREVFVCLLRAFNCAHDLILENKGMLTTLTVAVVLPLKHRTNDAKSLQESQFVCCVCNVGDTLAYVYSQKSGIRELTKGSHDVNCNRDLRDALGALGPVDGINPELSNLTLSVTTLSKGDMVIVASDGLTDNFDPNVCKFTISSTKAEVPKKNTVQPKVAVVKKEAQKPPIKPPRKSKGRGSISSANQSERSTSSSEKEVKVGVQGGSVKKEPELDDPLKAHFMRQNSLEEPAPKLNTLKPSNTRPTATQPRDRSAGNNQPAQAFRLMKAKTSLELRSYTQTQKNHILRNEDGLPFVSPIQRYELQLLLMEDILKNGISGRDKPTVTAKKLCENLASFTLSITAAKRRTLEDPDLYFDNRNGVSVEVSNQEKKLRRKRTLDKVQSLPGKLDHVTVVAYNVGNVF